MRWLLRAVLNVYPRAWRERYGREFMWLVDETGVGYADLLDIVVSAWGERMRTLAAKPLWQIIAFVVLGGLVGSIVAWVMPERYVSRAVVQVQQSGADGPHTMFRLAETALRRPPLQSLIATRRLYDSTSVTEEEKVAWLKRQISVTMLPRDSMFTIVFTHTDALTAQQVAADLVDLLQDASRAQSVVLNVIDPATLSTDPVHPAFGRVVATGLLAGLLTGTLVAAFTARRRRQPPAQHA